MLKVGQKTSQPWHVARLFFVVARANGFSLVGIRYLGFNLANECLLYLHSLIISGKINSITGGGSHPCIIPASHPAEIRMCRAYSRFYIHRNGGTWDPFRKGQPC